MRRRWVLVPLGVVVGWGLLVPPGSRLEAGTVEEPPWVAHRVIEGKLPPVNQRLPERPLVVQTDPEAGYGGELRMLIGTPKDLKLVFVYGYARLVRFDPDYRIVPDILEGVDVEEGRIFTLRLRRGHRWSDGAPFTSADFEYWWKHVATNPDLSPGGPPVSLLVDGEPPKVEFPDPWTVRYSWSKPNNFFLLDQASAYTTTLYRPAHYLRQFHADFADREKLDAMAQSEGRRNWAPQHNRLDRMYTMDNPDMPTLQPWQPTVKPPAIVFMAERNPYFHRVDQHGRQLPYLDRLKLVLADKAVIPIKTSTGETDLQARYLDFAQYTFLKQNERTADYQARLWSTAVTSEVTLYPNLTTTDAVMRKLFLDRRVRWALSLGIDRDEINNLIYSGVGVVGQNSVLGGETFRDELRMRHAKLEPDVANRLLDEVGLTRRDAKGFRLRPDGQRFDIIVETAGESIEQTDVLELIADHWAKIGIQLLVRPSQREVLRRRVFSGEAVMSVWTGEFGLPTPDMSPTWLAPVREEQLQWGQWGLHFQSGGKQGRAPESPAARRLVELYQEWLVSTNRVDRARIWEEMLKINSEEVFTIGTVGGTLQPVVVTNGLGGVPAKGVYAWDPGAHFGIYGPDTFYWHGGQRR